MRTACNSQGYGLLLGSEDSTVCRGRFSNDFFWFSCVFMFHGAYYVIMFHSVSYCAIVFAEDPGATLAARETEQGPKALPTAPPRSKRRSRFALRCLGGSCARQ